MIKKHLLQYYYKTVMYISLLNIQELLFMTY